MTSFDEWWEESKYKDLGREARIAAHDAWNSGWQKLDSIKAPRAEEVALYEWMLDHPNDTCLAFMEATNADTYGIKWDGLIRGHERQPSADEIRKFLRERLPELMKMAKEESNGES